MAHPPHPPAGPPPRDGWRASAEHAVGTLRRRWRGWWLARWHGLRAGRGLQANGAARVRKGWLMRFGEKVYVGENVALEGCLQLADRVYIGAGSQLKAEAGISIGLGTLLAPYVWISDYEHGLDTDRPIREQLVGRCAPVTVGEDCWIGYGAVIMSGSQIGDGAVIGANAVVPAGTVVPPYEIWGGVPARRLKSRRPEPAGE